MSKTEVAKLVLYALALAMGVALIALQYTEIPGSYDINLMLGISVFCLALGGIISAETGKF